MLNILFSNQLKNGKSLINELDSYIYYVYKLQFKKASQSIEICSKKVDEERDFKNNSSNELKRNQLFILSVYIEMFREYLVFWEQILKGEYSESWNTLQNLLGNLRILKKYNKDHEKFYLKFIEDQMTGLEKLYPYRLFASTEMILKKVKCSICGKDFHSLECEHLRGELYNGQMAYGIIKKVDKISAVALVENPKDKRCVQQLKNSEANFRGLTYLTKAVKELKISPWGIEGVKETTRKFGIGDFDIKRSETCPCGSEKTFGECCEQVGYVVLPHMDIIINKDVSLEKNHR